MMIMTTLYLQVVTDVKHGHVSLDSSKESQELAALRQGHSEIMTRGLNLSHESIPQDMEPRRIELDASAPEYDLKQEVEYSQYHNQRSSTKGAEFLKTIEPLLSADCSEMTGNGSHKPDEMGINKDPQGFPTEIALSSDSESKRVGIQRGQVAAASQPRKSVPRNPRAKKRSDLPTPATNRHEGHDCPRELRRLARLEEENARQEMTRTLIVTDEVDAVSQEDAPDQPSNEETLEYTTEQPLGEDPSQPTFPGQGSKEASKSAVISSGPPGGKRRRRKKSKDPYDCLPVLRPWHIHQQEMYGITEPTLRGKKNEKRFKILQFDDPFSQMVWALFRTADKDGNSKLNKKELNHILNSPRLELSLSDSDVERLLSDCSSDKDGGNKNLEISFDEFVPLGRLLLMLYYSKQDESSQSKWCILDKGPGCGLIYFDKLTGDASTSVPTDYHADILYEPDLLEIAIHDLCQTSDLNRDGKINLTDFLRILRSEDFGLFLTNSDVEEITQYFLNFRGKETIVDFEEFVPIAKRLMLIVFRGRDPSPHDWCHLYTRNVGSFWFNKRTGRAGRHPPTSLVREQQNMLDHRDKEIEVFAKVAEDLHYTKEDLEKETESRKKLEARLTEANNKLETTESVLSKTTENLEKARKEVDQMSKQVLLFEKQMAKQKNSIESLQNRADEADRIESTLQSLQDRLQNSQTAVKEKEFDVRSLTENLEKTQKELALTQQHAADLQDKVDDLMMQLREEIRRNERVETDLDRTKTYKNEKVEVEDILTDIKDELEMRMKQLTHARYEIRDNKAKIRRLETELDSVPDLRTELDEREAEIVRLKEEIEGLEMEIAQDMTRPPSPRPTTKRYRWSKVKNPNPPDNGHECSDPLCPVNGKGTPPSSSRSMIAAGGDAAHLWAFKKTSSSKHRGSFLELLDNVGADGGDLNIYDIYEPHSSPPRSPVPRGLHMTRPRSSAGRLETKKKQYSKIPSGVLLYEEDYMLARFVREGNRVRIKKSGVQILGMKPSDLRTATVRYIGQLEEPGGEHMLFAGLHMDDPVGNTDGVIDGKRYFHSKRRYGKMVRITEVLYVFNSKTTSFEKVIDLVDEYKASRRKPWQPPDDGTRLIKVA